MDKEQTKKLNEILAKRMKRREISDKKEKETAEHLKADNFYKVHIRDKRPKIVKAINRDKAIELAGEGAYRAFEVDSKYTIPKAVK